MTSTDLLTHYNYDAFVPENFMQWMRFGESPKVGTDLLDFPLWQIEDQLETSLKAITSENRFTVVEFGSFT